MSNCRTEQSRSQPARALARASACPRSAQRRVMASLIGDPLLRRQVVVLLVASLLAATPIWLDQRRYRPSVDGTIHENGAGQVALSHLHNGHLISTVSPSCRVQAEGINKDGRLWYKVGTRPPEVLEITGKRPILKILVSAVQFCRCPPPILAGNPEESRGCPPFLFVLVRPSLVQE